MRTSLLLIPLGLAAACYIDNTRLGNQTDTGTSESTDSETATDSGADSTLPPDTDTDIEDSGIVTGPVDVDFSIELVKTGSMDSTGSTSAADQLTVPGAAMMSPTNNQTYVLDASDAGGGGLIIHYLMDSYLYPVGDWCVGTEDDEGNCAGTPAYWYSGRVKKPTGNKPTQAMCLDRVNGRLYMVKDQGTRVEVADVALDGDDPYTYDSSMGYIDLPGEVTSLGRLLGSCEYLPQTDELLLTCGSDQDNICSAIAIVAAEPVSTAGFGAFHRGFNVGISPRHAYALIDGSKLIADDPITNAIVRIDTNTLGTDWSYELDDSVVHFGINRGTGKAFLAHGTAGAGMLDTNDASATEVKLSIDADIRWAFADQTHDLGWFVGVDGSGDWHVYLEQDGAIVSTMDLDHNVLSVAEPSDLGDLVVFTDGGENGSVAYSIFGPRASTNDGRPPLNIFLLTTIEEPSDTNICEPCTPSDPVDRSCSAPAGQTFEDEVNLVYSNAQKIHDIVIAKHGGKVAMAITDNFAEKAATCGRAEEIYGFLDGLGFELGAMLHNRPCYNCSNGDTRADVDPPSNPDYCAGDNASYIASGNSSACFPDDPEYCGIGDWDCYYAFLAPRALIADENIPGGAKFIVGGDRHGMWSYDWIRFYQEAPRGDGGYGYDLTLFAGTWAYNNIDYDDPRGKNPTPWRPQQRSAAWRPGDINEWDRDSAYSSLLYLSGTNSAVVKIGEQQLSGMYMADFFDFIGSGEGQISTLYDPSDFDVEFQNLRLSVNYRQVDHLNTWYFHIHDNGITNFGDKTGADVTVPDPNCPEGDECEPIPTGEFLDAFMTRINSRYVAEWGGTGEVVWTKPTEAKAQFRW